MIATNCSKAIRTVVLTIGLVTLPLAMFALAQTNNDTAPSPTAPSPTATPPTATAPTATAPDVQSNRETAPGYQSSTRVVRDHDDNGFDWGWLGLLGLIGLAGLFRKPSHEVRVERDVVPRRVERDDINPR